MCDFYDFDNSIEDADNPFADMFEDEDETSEDINPSQNSLDDNLKAVFRNFLFDAVDDARVYLNNGEVYLFFRVALNSNQQPIYRLYNTKDKDFYNILNRGYRVNVDGRNDTAANIKAVIRDSIDTLELNAKNHLQEKLFRIRVSHARGTALYDLCDQTNRVLKITSHGCEVEYKTDISSLFNYPISPTEQPYNHSQNIDDLNRVFDYINIAENERLLFKVYLVTCLIPVIPHPILSIYGAAMTGKSTTAYIIKTLIDPVGNEGNSGKIDILREANRSYFSVIDNITKLDDGKCNALIDIMGRENHVNVPNCEGQKNAYRFYPCICLAGNELASLKNNFSQRSLVFECQALNGFADRATFLSRFRQVQGHIFGAMVQTLSSAMSNYHEMLENQNIHEYVMSRFAQWGYVIANILEENGGEHFLTQYNHNLEDQNLQIVGQDNFVTLVVSFVQEAGLWAGTPTQLYDQLRSYARIHNGSTSAENFPRSASRLSRNLGGISEALITNHISLRYERTNLQRNIILTRTNQAVTAVTRHL